MSSLLFPDSCPYCQREETHRECLDLWQQSPSIRYLGSVPIFSVVPYDERAMAVVLAAKERSEERARALLVAAVSSVLLKVDAEACTKNLWLLIPIPASKSARRRRGEDFILELARMVASNDRIDAKVLPVLRWVRSVRDQSSLNLSERVQNLADALELDERRLRQWRDRNALPLHPPLSMASHKTGGEEIRILLVDDVLTSGATMAAAISAISHSSLGLSSALPARLSGVTACHSVRTL